MNAQRRTPWLLTMTAGALVAACGCQPREPRLTMEPQKAYVDARAVLFQSLEDDDPITRSHALEALAEVLPKRAGGAFMQGLGDASPAVRFAAVLAIGDARHAAAKARLLEMARDKAREPDKRVFAAVIYSLYRLGDDRYAPELGSLLFDPEKEVRANAALAMGKMGEPSAMGPLKALLDDEKDPGVQLQVVESLAMLGDSRSATLLEAYTKTPFLDERLVAIPAVARVRSHRAPGVLRDLLDARQPAQVRVAAAAALASLGQVEPDAFRLAMAAAENPQKVLEASKGRTGRATEIDVAVLRQLAARALGWMGRDAAVDVLHPLLKDKDGAVRGAAAMSILRLVSHYAPAEPSPTTAPQAPSSGPAPAPQTAPKLHSAGGRD